MKKLLSLVLLSAIVLVTMSARPVRSHMIKFHKRAIVDVYINNGTNYPVTLDISGNYYSQGPEGCGEVGTLNMLSANVTLSTTAPGTHQFMFTGANTQVTTGSASWFAVNITGDVTASVY